MPNDWVRRRKRDFYYRKAKEEEYRSRAAYKLLQVVSKYRFIESGDVALDLGAAPGGWLQALRKIVGEKGFVLGVDRRKIKPTGYSNVYTIVGDITDPELIKRVKAVLRRSADVVVSDVSPNVSGVWELDHARQMELAGHSLRIATSILVSNGNFFVKVFQGGMLSNFISDVDKYFLTTKLIKPKASRAESAEMYLLGLNLRENRDT